VNSRHYIIGNFGKEGRTGVGRRSRAGWGVERWDRGFESHLKRRCLSTIFCIVLSCVGRDVSGWPPVERVLPVLYVHFNSAFSATLTMWRRMKDHKWNMNWKGFGGKRS
jgi:hypothetical protein